MPKNESGLRSSQNIDRVDSGIFKNPSPKPTWKTKILGNLSLKIVSLIVTLILFAIVLTDRNVTVTFDEVPVVLMPPANYTVYDAPSTKNVAISVKGRAKLVQKLKREELGALIVSPVATNGYAQVSFTPDMLSLPDGVQITRFKPDIVSFTLEELAVRTVQVSTDNAFTGELMPGYQLGEVKISPETIEISGPKSLVSEINQVYIDPLDLTGRAESFTVDRWINPSRVGISTTSSSKVEVSVSVISKLKERVVMSVPIYAINLTGEYDFMPPTADLVLVGDEESLAKIDPSKLFIAIDGSEDEHLPQHSRIIRVTGHLVQNLPSGVALNETTVLTTVLRTHPKPDAVNAP